MWSAVDEDKDGKITVNEFVRVYCDHAGPRGVRELRVEVLVPGGEPQHFVAGQWDSAEILEYSLRLAASGIEIDSSRDHNQQLTFSVMPDGGCGGKFIRAWEETLPAMCDGQHSRIWILADKAFGENGVPGMCPPDADIVCEIKIGSIQMIEPTGGWLDQLSMYRNWHGKGAIDRAELDEVQRQIVMAQINVERERTEARAAWEAAEREGRGVKRLEERIARCQLTLEQAIGYRDGAMVARARQKMAQLTLQLKNERQEAEKASAKALKEEQEAYEAVKDGLSMCIQLLERQVKTRDGAESIKRQLHELGVVCQPEEWKDQDTRQKLLKQLAVSVVGLERVQSTGLKMMKHTFSKSVLEGAQEAILCWRANVPSDMECRDLARISEMEKKESAMTLQGVVRGFVLRAELIHAANLRSYHKS